MDTKGNSTMRKEKIYLHFHGDSFSQVQFALSECDYGAMVNILKNMKMTRKNFIILCRQAIDSGKTNSLKILLDIYHTYWKQEVFDELIKYVVDVRSFHFLGFLDSYIDKANDYRASIDNWNQYVRNQSEFIIEDENLSSWNKFINKIKDSVSLILNKFKPTQKL